MRKIFNYISYFISIIIQFISELFVLDFKLFNSIRSFFLKLTGIKIGKNTFIDRGFKFLYPKNIILGKNVSLGHHNKIWAFNKVIIGDYVQSAIGLTIVSGGHDVEDYGSITNNQEVILEGENWIGANVTIIGGVKVGIGTVIGAGSIVNKNLPPYTICAGNPCRVIKERKPSKKVVSPFGEYTPKFYEK
jgi:acetyltransferase-like isoleucine patch superfamily enzyme